MDVGLLQGIQGNTVKRNATETARAGIVSRWLIKHAWLKLHYNYIIFTHGHHLKGATIYNSLWTSNYFKEYRATPFSVVFRNTKNCRYLLGDEVNQGFQISFPVTWAAVVYTEHWFQYNIVHAEGMDHLAFFSGNGRKEEMGWPQTQYCRSGGWWKNKYQ